MVVIAVTEKCASKIYKKWIYLLYWYPEKNHIKENFLWILHIFSYIDMALSWYQGPWGRSEVNGTHVGLTGTRFGLTGTCVGSMRLFRYQHVGIGNAKVLHRGYCPTRNPQGVGFSVAVEDRRRVASRIRGHAY